MARHFGAVTLLLQYPQNLKRNANRLNEKNFLLKDSFFESLTILGINAKATFLAFPNCWAIYIIFSFELSKCLRACVCVCVLWTAYTFDCVFFSIFKSIKWNKINGIRTEYSSSHLSFTLTNACYHQTVPISHWNDKNRFNFKYINEMANALMRNSMTFFSFCSMFN